MQHMAVTMQAADNVAGFQKGSHDGWGAVDQPG